MQSSRRLRLARPSLLATVMLAALLIWTTPALARQPGAQDKAAAQKRLNDVRERMEALAREQAETANRRDSVNAELARRAKALAVAAGALRATDDELAAKQHDLEQLQQQRQALQQKLDSQRAAIADLLRATYAVGRGSDLRLLLGDEDVTRIARALAYSRYFQEDRMKRVQQLMGDLAELQTVESKITVEQQALQATRDKQSEQAKALASQRAAQKKLADQVAATYRDERQRLAALKQSEQSLTSLVSKLQAAIDQAARDAEREAARSNAHTPSADHSSSPVLANIRGNLPWPASGDVHSYGNGVLIKATGGSEVHAVATGRVVFANFLRGYGMLVILDHGHGWMSMYGNNEALLHRVGDTVEAGEAVGTAMTPTGVNTGAYFELRNHNKPVDPRSWLASHR